MIIVSVRVLYTGFSISLVFRFLGFRVSRFSGFLDGTGRKVLLTGRDAELDNKIVFYENLVSV